MSDEEIEALEASFPALAGQAFAAERRKTLEAGFSVLQAEGGIIYEVFPDGRRVQVKQIEAPVSVRCGTRFRLRWADPSWTNLATSKRKFQEP